MMARLLLLILAILMSGDAIHALIKQPNYWQLREQLLMDEKRLALGGDLELGPIEVKANRVLMAAKNREILNGSMFSFTIAREHTIRLAANKS